MLSVSYQLVQTYVLPFQETEEPIEFSPKSVAEYLMRTGETDEFQGLLNDLVEASEVSTMSCAKQLQRKHSYCWRVFVCVGCGMHCFEQSSVAVGDTVDGVHVVLIKARLYYCSTFVGMAVYIDT